MAIGKYDRGMGELPDHYIRRLQEHLYCAKPDEAEFYALVRMGSGAGAARRYPETAGFRLCPAQSFEPPYGVPPGDYLVSFYKQQFDNTMLPYRKTHPSFRVTIQWPTETYLSSAPRSDNGGGIISTTVLAADPELRDAQIEFEKHKMAVAMQRDTHKLVRSAAHARDIGESYSVVAAYRHDSYLNAEAYAALNRRMTENLTKIQETHISLVQSIEPTIVAVKRASELLAVPPARVDYSPVLAELVQVGGAMLTRLLDHDTKRRGGGEEPRELGEARSVKKTENPPANQAAQKADAPADTTAAAPAAPPPVTAALQPVPATPPHVPAAPPQGPVGPLPRPPEPAPIPPARTPVAAAPPPVPAEPPLRPTPATAIPAQTQPQSTTPVPIPAFAAQENLRVSPAAVAPDDSSEEERLINELAGAPETASAPEPIAATTGQAAPAARDLPLAEPGQRKTLIDRLTDPHRPELAAATQIFLEQFDSEEELAEQIKLVVTTFNPRLMSKEARGNKG